MKVWNFVGRADAIHNPGDYYTLDFAGVPLLIRQGRRQPGARLRDLVPPPRRQGRRQIGANLNPIPAC